jgi:N-acyl homoserine lactone hydrolase
VPVSGDLEILEGVTLIATPGHTPGHQSVLVENNGERVLIAAQTAFSADEFLRGGDPDTQAHEGYAETYQQSIVQLKALEASTLYFSHDDSVQTQLI